MFLKKRKNENFLYRTAGHRKEGKRMKGSDGMREGGRDARKSIETRKCGGERGARKKMRKISVN
jgi:hypothetical protein